MDSTRDSEGTQDQFPCKKEVEQSEVQQVLVDLPQTSEVDLKKMPQNFYKNSYKSSSGQNIVKHGYKAFTIGKSEEDLCIFCLSLLQFEAMFPIRFFMVQKQKGKQEKSQNHFQKDVWLETQFLTFTNTTNFQYQQYLKLENKVHQFFTQKLIPKLSKFKEERMSWAYMVTQQYTDEKVIQEFQIKIVKDANQTFKANCKEI